MDEGSCPLCGETVPEGFFAGRERTAYFRCAACGYVWLHPALRPTPASERSRYLLHENDPDDPGYRRWLGDFLAFALPGTRPGDDVLDFGSGPRPVLAAILEEQGYHVRTEDPFFAPGTRSGPFDLITALEVFEHLFHPGITIRGLAGRLKPGGRLCVSTLFLPGDPADFDGWHYRQDGTHVGFFTEDALVAAGARSGLETVATDHRRNLALRRGPLVPRSGSC